VEEEKAANIRAVAKWADLEEDATWHTRVSGVLFEAGHYDQASDEFQAAIAMDPMFWRAYSGLAWIYQEQHNWAQASETMEKCLQIFENDAQAMIAQRTHYVWCLSWVSRWRLCLGQKGMALKSYEKAFELSPRDYSLAAWVFRILTDMKQYEKIMDRLAEMKNDIVPSLGYSRLTEMCMFWCDNNCDPFAGITAAARETKRVDTVREILASSIRAARKNSKTTTVLGLQMNLGLLLFREYEDHENAINLWKSVLENSGFAKPGTPSYAVRYRAAEELCRVYADRAVSTNTDSPAFATCVETLEDLLKIVNKKNLRIGPLEQKSEEWAHGAAQAIMLTLGMLYRLSGRNQEARACFTPHLKLGIDILSDDDPDNDWIAYSKLCKVFNHAGDDLNFQACTRNPTWVICDGICGLGPPMARGLSTCQVCINLDFCEDCLKLLHRNELPAKRCNPKHQFIKFGAFEKMQQRGMMRVGDSEIPLKEWLEDIKKTWDL
jgi:tetratricopeptide (TPR) repeat protein